MMACGGYGRYSLSVLGWPVDTVVRWLLESPRGSSEHKAANVLVAILLGLIAVVVATAAVRRGHRRGGAGRKMGGPRARGQ